jgi:phosphatidylglycerophosphate synthase
MAWLVGSAGWLTVFSVWEKKQIAVARYRSCGCLWSAFLLVLFHDYLDHLDGIVAKAQAALGHQDDPHLGCFLDAFCDKVVCAAATGGCLLLAAPSATWTRAAVFNGVPLAVVAVEIALGVVRVDDYYAVRYGGQTVQCWRFFFFFFFFFFVRVGFLLSSDRPPSLTRLYALHHCV